MKLSSFSSVDMELQEDSVDLEQRLSQTYKGRDAFLEFLGNPVELSAAEILIDSLQLRQSPYHPLVPLMLLFAGSARNFS